MVNNPLVSNALSHLSSWLRDMEKDLISLDLTTEEIREQVPFSAKNERKIRRLVRGGVFSNTQRKLADINNGDAQVTYWFNFYTNAGGKLNPRSSFSQVKDYWIKKSTGARRTYLSNIGLYLSSNLEGRIIKRLNEKKYAETTNTELVELRKQIDSLIRIVTKTKKDVDAVIRDFNQLGLNPNVF